VENPDKINEDIVAPFALIPAEQPPFYDEEGNPLNPSDPFETFGLWIEYALTAASFHAAEVVEAMTYFDLPQEEEDAYDAPFPSRIYMAGPRTFPSLINGVPGVNDDAWAGLTSYEKPFLTIWASNDPGNLGSKEVQDNLINNIPGAAGQPHVRLPEASHFLQDDQGAEIAGRIVEFIEATKNDLNTATTGESSPHVGFEILEIQSTNSIRAWISSDITQEEFDALELPGGWFKNQPREGDPDANHFYRSPGAAVEGEFLEEELFGFSWWHSATVIQPNIPLDEQGLLTGSTVAKYHEVTFNAGTTIYVLFSPEGEPYVRIGRDANRASDEPSIPNSWRLVEYATSDQLVIQLPEETLVIRADNEDSFQGPVPELAVAL
jgi:hypothetical protein